MCVDSLQTSYSNTAVPLALRKPDASEAHFICVPPPLNAGFNMGLGVASADEHNFSRHISQAS